VNEGSRSHYIKTQCFAVPRASDQAFYKANCDQSKRQSALLECLNLRGDLGRNTPTGPVLLNFDLSVVKNNYVKESQTLLMCSSEQSSSNVFNRANFAPPLDNRNIFDATGAAIANAGLITSRRHRRGSFSSR